MAALGLCPAFNLKSLIDRFWPGVDDECVEKLKLWMTGIEK